MKNDRLFAQVWADAQAAGKSAAEQMFNNGEVVPMLVGQADGFSDRFAPGAKLEYVADGVCGFAWIHFPKLPGNEFAQWLRKKGIGHKGYPKGWDVSIHAYNQSMQLKEAHAYAMAKHLQKHGVDCYSQSRMD